MTDKKILYVSSEVIPYLAENEVSASSYNLSKMVVDSGGQIRIFMPRYGNINERRHQLHEVIRLSGMNLIVNDMDVPLIIKVASIPKERIQVYFIDNDEYFKRKSTFSDEDDVMYDDNDERAIFFAKGVLETIKKLNWVPDIIHVHGWLASFLPLYLKTFYKNEALFARTKIVSSVYNAGFEGVLSTNLKEKLVFDNMNKADIEVLSNSTFEALMQTLVNHSDAIVVGSENLNENLTKIIETSKKPFLPFTPILENKEKYINFYKEVL
jgi:starch synthase